MVVAQEAAIIPLVGRAEGGSWGCHSWKLRGGSKELKLRPLRRGSYSVGAGISQGVWWDWLVLGVWRKAGKDKLLLLPGAMLTGTGRSKSLLHPLALQAPSSTRYWITGTWWLRSNVFAESWPQHHEAKCRWMDVELRAKNVAESTHFGKCPHFCVPSGPFPWDKGWGGGRICFLFLQDIGSWLTRISKVNSKNQKTCQANSKFSWDS